MFFFNRSYYYVSEINENCSQSKTCILKFTLPSVGSFIRSKYNMFRTPPPPLVRASWNRFLL